MTTEPTPPKIDANWSISLNCDCPHCGEWVDLLDSPDFWEGRKFQTGEHGTDLTENVEVICPECGEEFTCDLTF